MGDAPVVRKAAFDRPVDARLVVRTDTGEEWDASHDDLAKFGLVDRQTVYGTLRSMLMEGFGIENLDNSDLVTSIRYVIECGIFYDHTPWSQADGTPWDEDEDCDTKAVLRGALAAWEAEHG